MSIFKKTKEENSNVKSTGLFGKVTIEQFIEDWNRIFNNKMEFSEIEEIYNNIKLPERSTKKSAGYDFFSPVGFKLRRGENIVIPTGIRVFLDDDMYLACYPRSGMGFKHRLSLVNTCGIIDADYWESSNEGHIMLKLSYDGVSASQSLIVSSKRGENGKLFIDTTVDVENKKRSRSLVIRQGDKIVQGIINKYYISEDDSADGVRDGGMGSTGK